MLLLKYLRNFWKTFEMPLINCELIFFDFVWIMYYSNQKFNNRKPKFAITDTNSYVPVVTFSVQDNEKILQQLKRGFKKKKKQKNDI